MLQLRWKIYWMSWFVRKIQRVQEQYWRDKSSKARIQRFSSVQERCNIQSRAYIEKREEKERRISIALLTKLQKYDTIFKGVWRNGNARGFDPCIRQFDPANPCHWVISSVGQSYRLITGWSWVQVPDDPPRQCFGESYFLLTARKDEKCRWVKFRPSVRIIWIVAEKVDANQLGIGNGACCRVYKTRVKQVVSLHQ